MIVYTSTLLTTAIIRSLSVIQYWNQS